jgi:hypothetical protein
MSRRERMVMVEPRGSGIALFALRAADEVRAPTIRRQPLRTSSMPKWWPSRGRLWSLTGPGPEGLEV